MKKVLTTILTAGLAFAMISTSGTAYADESEESTGYSEASVEFIGGDLTLNKVSDIEFGSHDLSEKEFNIQAVNDVSATVTDHRGKLQGWHVTAKLSEFKNSERGLDDSLPAAQIILNDGNVTSTVGNSTNFENLTSKEIIVEKEEVKVVTAPKGFGNGKSDISWESNNVSLKVPNSVLAIATSGSHKAEITWTLKDVPQ